MPQAKMRASVRWTVASILGLAAGALWYVSPSNSIGVYPDCSPRGLRNAARAAALPHEFWRAQVPAIRAEVDHISRLPAIQADLQRQVSTASAGARATLDSLRSAHPFLRHPPDPNAARQAYQDAAQAQLVDSVLTDIAVKYLQCLPIARERAGLPPA